MRLNAKSHLVGKISKSLNNCLMRSNARLPRVLGSRVRRARRNRGLTQEELAEKVGISRVYMGYIEQGRHAPSLEVLQKIAGVLKVHLSELLK